MAEQLWECIYQHNYTLEQELLLSCPVIKITITQSEVDEPLSVD